MKPQATTAPSPKKARRVGLVRHARELGVSTNHLWLVLEGKRPSPGLVRRYQELIEREKEGNPFNVVGSALARLGFVFDQLDEDAPPDAQANLDAARKYREIVDAPALAAAIAAVRSRLPLSTVAEFAALLTQPDFDNLFGLKRAADNPRKIIIGGAA